MRVRPAVLNTNTIIMLAFAGLALSTGRSEAQTPAYVGTWADRPAQCRTGQELEDAPLIMKRSRYDQHEAHCTFKSVRRQAGGWAVKAQCVVEGNTVDSELTLAVASNRLTMRDEFGSRTLQRCR